VNVELAEDEVMLLFAKDDVRLLINVIQAAPVQGNLRSLPQMIDRLRSLQQKLAASLNPHPSPLPRGEGKSV
jgi:hypothetical protein